MDSDESQLCTHCAEIPTRCGLSFIQKEPADVTKFFFTLNSKELQDWLLTPVYLSADPRNVLDDRVSSLLGESES
jgi:hypothetical protein